MSATADRIFTNANVITMDPQSSKAAWVAVADGKILEVGSGDFQHLVGSATVQQDLGGQTLLPGFIESHNHFNAVANQWGWVDVGITTCKTIPQVLQTIKEAATKLQENLSADQALLPWVKCTGFDDTLIEEHRNITRTDLDGACADLPIWVWHPSMHRVYVNSKALEITGIDDSVADPGAGGVYVRDAEGKLTGQMEEMSAYQPVYMQLNKTIDMRTKGPDMWATAVHFASRGITTIHDLFVGPMLFNLYRNAFSAHTAEKPFPIRVSLYAPAHWEDRPEATGFDPLFLRFGGTKLFADGSIQCHTACCLQPYHDQGDTKGALTFPPEKLAQIVAKFHAKGQIAVHCNGDGAIEAIIDAVEQANATNPRPDHRHRIEHCQMVTAEQLERMNKAGITASFFVSHVYFWGDRHKDIFLGPDRSQTISPLRTATENGIRFGLHSDCPITPVNPLHSMWTAVTRKMKNNEVLGQDERISVEQALKAYTIDAAYLSFEEDIKGSIEAGKLADFVVLAEDPFQVDEDRLPEIQISQTIVGGRTVYART